ncbi:hypothetical protein [Mucilaginibacter terrae]|uniref:Uncharacterized protein n=1 Tax=Mucilaginibacter terrae TaxID=1955052 RepID=A0ABU3H2E6_9SPHI|nr:hypothetical protein [Mucilaginibacter terrae]MDT3405427.1 hypothetical protein [Mucilaginibacter terrae]
MKKLILLISSIYFICSCQSQSIFKIVPFKVLNYLDTTKENNRVSITKMDVFLIKDYRDTKNFDKYLSNYINKHKASDYKRYANYLMVFYRETERTNLKGNSYSTDIVKKYSRMEDMVRGAIWVNGKLIGIEKFEDGQPVLDDSDTSVTIRDIKD